MATTETGVINIGQAVRDGLRLKTIDVVALLHDVCTQLDVDGAKKLPTSVDELSINDAGSVVMQSGRPSPTLRTAVATLLDALLSTLNDEPEAVPPALGTLPARLRAAGNAAKASDVKDLLTILRWHMPHEPRQVLRELVIRARLTAVPNTEPLVDDFVDEEPVAARPRGGNVHRFSFRAAHAAALLSLMLSAYAGYRFSRRAPEPMVTRQPAQSVEQTAPSPLPRVVIRETAAVGEEPRPLQLAVDGGAFSPSFAEGRRLLLFHSGHNTSGKIFSAALDDNGRASSITALVEDRGRAYHVRLSPDGQWLAFDSDRDGERGVYIARRDGSRVERISGEGYAAVPTWSPDMKTIAFVRGESGDPRVWNLWQRDLATGAVTRLTNFRSGQAWGASWFADSNRYVYSHDDRLVIADRDGRELATFSSPTRGRLVRTPAVSPDGRRIVFQVFRDGVWIVDVASGQMRRVLDDPTAEEFAWHPDGRHVAYHSRRDGQWRIWLMRI